MRRNAGPNTTSRVAATATPASVARCCRRRFRSMVRWYSTSWHFSIACSTRRSTSACECVWSPAASALLASTALRREASSVGSHSSRYRATCASLTCRFSGRQSQSAARVANTTATITRNATIAAALNLSASRPEADSSSAMTLPATTTTTPRSASFRRQRFLIFRMTSTSSARCPPIFSLPSEVLGARFPVPGPCVARDQGPRPKDQ